MRAAATLFLRFRRHSGKVRAIRRKLRPDGLDIGLGALARDIRGRGVVQDVGFLAHDLEIAAGIRLVEDKISTVPVGILEWGGEIDRGVDSGNGRRLRILGPGDLDDSPFYRGAELNAKMGDVRPEFFQ